jgi:hypothetical protein
MLRVADKIVVVTKETPLEALVVRFNTWAQARFYIQRMRADFAVYQSAHEAYKTAVQVLRDALPDDMRAQWIDRAFLPNFTFGEGDIVVTLGPDGLVVNTAKYLNHQPLVALNPDPARIDGVLLPFNVSEAATAIALARSGRAPMKRITMAKAVLNDGQTLHAVNDLFIGQKTHVSARYKLRHRGREETQSSSGIIVSTGAGSTGWYRSVVTGAAGVMSAIAANVDGKEARERYRFDWEAKHLVFSVREPFISRTSGASIVHGKITAEMPLTVVSEMPQNGVIFSDGVEEDFVAFNSGAIATITISEKKLHLVVSPTKEPERRQSGPLSRHTGARG